MDLLLAVVEPGRRSLDTIERIKLLGQDIGIDRVFAVGNKIMNESEEKYIMEAVESKGIPLIGMIPYDETLREADRQAIAPLDFNENGPAVEAIKKIKADVLAKLDLIQTEENE